MGEPDVQIAGSDFVLPHVVKRAKPGLGSFRVIETENRNKIVRTYEKIPANEAAPPFHLVEKPFFDGAKRGVDLILCLLIGPFVLLACPIVKLIQMTSSGPLFFVHERIGKGGKAFRMVKFRSMDVSANASVCTTQQTDRIIRGGIFMRRYRIDELPQVWNILKGDMSFIGPRPERVTLVNAFNESIPGYVNRHAVLPGISGLSQVRMGYAAVDRGARRNRLKYDIFYIAKRGLLLDLKIAYWTISTLLTGRGAI